MKCIGETVREFNNLEIIIQLKKIYSPLLICNPRSRINYDIYNLVY